MKRIRIGNDITLYVRVTRSGQDEQFEDSEATLQLVNSTTTVDLEFERRDKYLVATWLGSEQKRTGVYNLVVRICREDGSMNTVDKCAVFQLVPHSCQEDVETGGSVCSAMLEVKMASQQQADTLEAYRADLVAALQAKGIDITADSSFSDMGEALSSLFYDGLDKITIARSGGSVLSTYTEGDITLPNLETLDNSSCAANNCSALTSLSLPSLTSITGGSAANSCSALTSLSLPSLTSIASGSAANGCSALTSLSLPSLTSIGGNQGVANGVCTSLKTIELPSLASGNVLNSGTDYPALELISLGAGESTNTITINNGSPQRTPKLVVTVAEGFGHHLNMKQVDMDEEKLMDIINNLANYTGRTAHNLQLGTDNLAKLSDEQKAVATGKNWTLS